MPRMFSLHEARALLAEARVHGERLREAYGGAVDALPAVTEVAKHNGAGPELFAHSQELWRLLAWFERTGVQVKGLRPLLLDFPTSGPGGLVLLCWVEPEQEIGWYHTIEDGFPGRRPIEEL